MKVIRHPRHADGIMRIEGTLAVGGVGGGLLLWTQASHFGGYGFAAAAFLSLGGVQAGVRALRNFNRWHRGAEGEDSVLHTLRSLPDTYTAVANFAPPGVRQGDMDLLVLGPAGVLVLEIKSYTGRFACAGDQWCSVGPDNTRRPLRGSVSRQLKRAGKSAAHFLVDADRQVPVHLAAVFRAGAELELHRPTVPVVRENALRDHILSLPPAPVPCAAADLAPLFAPAPATRRFQFRRQGRLSGPDWQEGA